MISCKFIKIFYVNILFSCLIIQVFSEWNTKDYMKRDQSLVKPYQGSGVVIPNWDILGHTIVTPQYVRLTPDLQSKQGAIWNSVPNQVKNWELQVQFKVHGKGKDLFGDGMSIWYVRDRMQIGSMFGSKDYFSGLSVLLDTYSNHNGPHNHQHPYVSAMVNNGTLHYDHDKDGTHTQLAGCEAKFRNFEHDTHLAIRYERDTLKVSLDVDNKASWKECFTVSGVRLPTGYYFGISATTGDLSDNHDVISVRLYELDLPDDKSSDDRSQIVPSAQVFEPPRERKEDTPPTSWTKTFLIMMFFSILIIVLAVVGIMYYQKQQEQSRKRFY